MSNVNQHPAAEEADRKRAQDGSYKEGIRHLLQLRAMEKAHARSSRREKYLKDALASVVLLCKAQGGPLVDVVDQTLSDARDRHYPRDFDGEVARATAKHAKKDAKDAKDAARFFNEMQAKKAAGGA